MSKEFREDFELSSLVEYPVERDGLKIIAQNLWINYACIEIMKPKNFISF